MRSSAARDAAPSRTLNGASTEGTFHYAVFGGVLRSQVPFPELVLTAARVTDWSFRVADGAPLPDESLVPVGQRQLGPETYRLWSGPRGLRLEYSHAGCFDISADGRQIVWYHRPDALLELVRAIVLGPALALALELAGVLCLHGSAVSLDDRAIAFVGPKHHGKSTLATALTAAGARLVGDDLVPVVPGRPAMVRPGVASVRLWSDAANRLAVGEICGTVIEGVKTTATGFANEALMHTATPLTAVYVLEPVRPEMDDRAAWRTRLPMGAATIALAQQAKLPDSLIGLPQAGARLRAAAAVAATVPVFTLHAVRDFARLDALVTQIMEWTRGERERSTSNRQNLGK